MNNKIIRTSNSKCGEYVENKVEFKANNIFAESNGVSMYCVFSYGYHFPMYVYLNGRWFENSDKYSVSTSKQQTQARPSYKMQYKTTAELLNMIRENNS
tara:strand:- start:427 stop:723 length:297 start_codon:yes stop_codon:yes gene_type:complete